MATEHDDARDGAVADGGDGGGDGDGGDGAGGDGGGDSDGGDGAGGDGVDGGLVFPDEISVEVGRASYEPHSVPLREGTASHLSKILVRTFQWTVLIWALVSAFAFVWQVYHDKSPVDSLSAIGEWAKSAGVLLSGPLGFVLGYYFRQSSTD